ncbi:MAG TPA: response regulator transcription factor [Thermoanaerobaculia bacterium]|nr:response regulator transcription factor [Thermoanaerobaculia bacterium]
MSVYKIRVLIVDDHAIVRTGLRLLISGQDDMTVVGEAGATQEGIQAAERLSPDVALIDLSLPGEGGIEAIRQLRRTRPRVRTVALTMHDDPAYLRSVLSAGGSGYVVKRAAGSELLAAIRAVRDGRSFVSPLLAEAEAQAAPASPQVSGEAEGALARLSARERQVLVMLAHGHTHAEMAEQLGISVKTVETHRARLSEKLGLKSRSDLVRLALEAGLLATGSFVKP